MAARAYRPRNLLSPFVRSMRSAYLRLCRRLRGLDACARYGHV